MLAAASIKVMHALFGLVARNDAEWSIGESFWDAHGVEIGARAIFEHLAPSGKIDGTGKKRQNRFSGDHRLRFPTPEAPQDGSPLLFDVFHWVGSPQRLLHYFLRRT